MTVASSPPAGLDRASSAHHRWVSSGDRCFFLHRYYGPLYSTIQDFKQRPYRRAHSPHRRATPRSPRLPSMRPRPSGRGNLTTARHDGRCVVPSIRPRPSGRGNDHCCARSRHRSRSLQSGPGLPAGETLVTPVRRQRLAKPFNQAPAFRPGKRTYGSVPTPPAEEPFNQAPAFRPGKRICLGECRKRHASLQSGPGLPAGETGPTYVPDSPPPIPSISSPPTTPLRPSR